jgi:cell division protein FtsB
MQIQKSIQVLLWLWFGLITSFCAVNVANIVKLETQVKSLENHNKTLNQRVDFLKLELIK